jgi:hypothetical protein
MRQLNRPFGEPLFRLRTTIERRLGGLTNTASRRGPLPNWVRRRHRVRKEAHAKLLLYAIRLTPL